MMKGRMTDSVYLRYETRVIGQMVRVIAVLGKKV